MRMFVHLKRMCMYMTPPLPIVSLIVWVLAVSVPYLNDFTQNALNFLIRIV